MNLKSVKAQSSRRVSDSNDKEQFLMNLLVFGKATCPVTDKEFSLKRNGTNFNLLKEGEEDLSFEADTSVEAISRLKEHFEVEDTEKVSDSAVTDDYLKLISPLETFGGTFIEATGPGIFASFGNGGGDIEFVPKDSEDFGEYDEAPLKQEVKTPGWYAVNDAGEILSVLLTGNLLEDIQALSTIEWEWETYPSVATIANNLQKLLESDTSVTIYGLEVNSSTEDGVRQISSDEGSFAVSKDPSNEEIADYLDSVASWFE